MKQPQIKPERWQQVEALYLAALEREAGQRASFLAEACVADEALRYEVESLLRFHEQAGNFIEAPALEVAAQLQAASQNYSLVGRQIGPYQILSLLGAGGMGEVYRAQDARLDRAVAIKVLPPHLAQDPEALVRFKLEAKAVAALSHPNILAIHDFGTEQGVSYAVMELLEGETLRSRLARSALPWQKAVEIGIALAEGLAAAHTKGITHRDLKPENLFITKDDRVKILDFGLARMKPQKFAGRMDAEAPTRKTLVRLTAPGRVIGTIGYMSPEQLRGEEVDAPSDIFSFGCVLYEMVTGRGAFAHQTTAETIAAIMTDDPPTLAASDKEAPLELERLVHHCLEKQAGQRYQSARDLAFDLGALLSGMTTSAKPLAGVRARPLTWLAAAMAILLLVIAAWLYLNPDHQDTIDSLAILPLTNGSTDPNMEYLSDGITESLINSMSQLPKLKVIARTTVFRYKGRADPRQVGGELKVRAVLTGRITQQGDTISVQADLIDVADGSQLWGGRYHHKLSDLIALPEEMAQQVSDKLRLKLTGGEQKQLTKHSTADVEAYRLYHKGRYFWNKRNAEAIKLGIECFQQALARDPGYALAYVGLADSYAILPTYSETSADEARLKAMAAASKALELDETLAEAQTTLGSVSADQWDWPEAEKRFKRAIELNPGYATAHGWYADYLVRLGRVDEALAEIKLAYELDPLSLHLNTAFASILYCARQYDHAIEQARKTLELEPNFIQGHVHLAVFLLQTRKYEEAIAELNKAKTLSGGHSSVLGPLGYAYAVAGQRKVARQILDELSARAKRRHVPSFDLAVIHLGLGQIDQTFALLKQACAERSSLVTLLKAEPFFDSLRADPRFADLLQCIGLTP